ncbi:alpha/beta fold hydrolase [Microcoleus sp. FACHB-68]|nr:alpha/beta fold hydrolase [Microcoleus sp. FACHB-68]
MSNLQTLALQFVELLVQEDFAGATGNFDSQMQASFPPDKLRETWTAITGQVGKFEKTAGIRSEKDGEYDIVFVTSEFEKATLDIKIIFNSNQQIAGLFVTPTQPAAEYQPPAYVNVNTFQEQAVVVGSGEIALPATLTLPVGDGPFPAIVLVHGSGPNDRDESVGPNKPFRDLAWGLASRGIAVLRYEKRTRVYPNQFAGSFTVREETTDDALAAVSLLRQIDKIEAQKIYVLGHSLGGMLIPRIGKADAKIAGFIVMAGLTRFLEDTVLDQVNYIAALDGVISPEEQAEIEALTQQAARVKDPQLSKKVPAAELLFGIPASYWLDLRGYHPPTVAQQLTQRMLILQGERDYQVTMEDFQGWQQALSSRQNVTFKSYPQLNHLFIEGTGKSVPAEYQSAGYVAEPVINDIAEWIKK